MKNTLIGQNKEQCFKYIGGTNHYIDYRELFR